jgi:hypothetical protein
MAAAVWFDARAMACVLAGRLTGHYRQEAIQRLADGVRSTSNYECATFHTGPYCAHHAEYRQLATSKARAVGRRWAAMVPETRSEPFLAGRDLVIIGGPHAI